MYLRYSVAGSLSFSTRWKHLIGRLTLLADESMSHMPVVLVLEGAYCLYKAAPRSQV